MWRTLHLTGLDVEPCGRGVHAMVVAEPFEQALPAVFVEVVHAAIKAVRGLSRSHLALAPARWRLDLLTDAPWLPRISSARASKSSSPTARQVTGDPAAERTAAERKRGRRWPRR